MFRQIPHLLVVIVATFPLILVADEPAKTLPVTTEQAAFFETRIRPVLIDRCLDCHGAEDPENGLNLSSRAAMIRGGKLGTALRPGKPGESLLISAIKHDEFIKMPPKEKLPTGQVVDFTRWVEMGAPWPDSEADPDLVSEGAKDSGGHFTEKQLRHWAFQTVVAPEVPGCDSSWPVSPIDHFVLKRLTDAGLSPARPADRRTLIRRATFDLTGLPPSPTEVQAFLADSSPNAFETVVDRLLASPRYGERWGRHWLDVARYADSNGLDENLSYANAWRYRDYVISALNSDKPYARFVQEQLAGDLLPEPEDEQDNLDRYIATGFLAIGPKMLAEDDPVKMQMDIIDEQLNTLGQTFMGLTLGCARCHDHKFDPLPTKDYYSLAGIFKSSRTMENHKVVAVWYERPLVSRSDAEKIAEIDRRIAATTSQSEQLRTAHRENIARQMQDQFAQYLLAAAAVERLQQENTRPAALAEMKNPFPVTDGFALIEAEAFHRGNVEKLFTGYGEGIGTTGTRGAGHMEFDVKVEHPGRYVLEIRHAAAESRPLRLVVNGETVEQTVVGQVTGSWHPDGQQWFPAGTILLHAGTNTIRLDSDKVHPHVDRLSLLFFENEEWPFPNPAPATVSSIARNFGVNGELVGTWRTFLLQISDGSVKTFPSLNLWLEFTELSAEDFATNAPGLLAKQRASNESLPRVTDLLAQTPLTTLEDAAEVFRLLLADEEVRKELLQAPSPLAGPKEILIAHLPPKAGAEFQTLLKMSEALKASRPSPGVAMGVTEGTPEDLRIHLRGSHIALGETAPRRFPEFLSGTAPVPSSADGNGQKEVSNPIPSEQSGRLQLAQWMTQPDHPLTWRVIVNRVWHWRFGRGLSPSVDNFGLLGQAPTHPQLLDWLAKRFQESGGSLKQLHRLMMLSKTYQMSTDFRSEASGIDPENERLWRFRRRRLTGEELRDSLLFLGEGLDETRGGTLLKVANRSYVTGSGTSITDEFRNRRRSVYLPVVRSSVYDVLQTFDFPDPAVPAGERQASIVAPQALMMMNSELVEQQTMALAKKTLALPAEKRVTALYSAILNRPPEATEAESVETWVAQARQTSSLSELTREESQLRAWQSLCRVLLSSNEFAYVE